MTALHVAFALLALPLVAVAAVALWPAPTEPSFDEHAATAAALLQPDAPTLPEPLSFADQVELWLALHTPKES